MTWPASCTRRIQRAAQLGYWCIAGLIAPQMASAQRPSQTRRPGITWTIIDAIGYGGAGLVIGYAGTVQTSSGFASGLTVAALTTAAGLGLGATVGRAADRALAGEDSVSGQLRAAAFAGAVLGGATLGALATVPLIIGDGDGTPLGGDIQTFAIATGTGAALGLLLIARQRRRFRTTGRTPSGLSLAPFSGRHGASGIRVQVAF